LKRGAVVNSQNWVALFQIARDCLQLLGKMPQSTYMMNSRCLQEQMAVIFSAVLVALITVLAVAPQVKTV